MFLSSISESSYDSDLFFPYPRVRYPLRNRPPNTYTQSTYYFIKIYDERNKSNTVSGYYIYLRASITVYILYIHIRTRVRFARAFFENRVAARVPEVEMCKNEKVLSGADRRHNSGPGHVWSLAQNVVKYRPKRSVL